MTEDSDFRLNPKGFDEFYFASSFSMIAYFVYYLKFIYCLTSLQTPATF